MTTQHDIDIKASNTILGWNIWIFPPGDAYPTVKMGIPPAEVENYVALFGLSMDDVERARFDR